MFVVVEHVITKPDVFFGLAGKVGEAPPGIDAIHFFPEYKQRSGSVSMGSQVGRRFEGLAGTHGCSVQY